MRSAALDVPHTAHDRYFMEWCYSSSYLMHMRSNGTYRLVDRQHMEVTERDCGTWSFAPSNVIVLRAEKERIDAVEEGETTSLFRVEYGEEIVTRSNLVVFSHALKSFAREPNSNVFRATILTHSNITFLAFRDPYLGRRTDVNDVISRIDESPDSLPGFTFHEIDRETFEANASRRHPFERYPLMNYVVMIPRFVYAALGLALVAVCIASIVVIAILRPRGTCPVCGGVLTYGPVFRSPNFGKLKCPHCRTKLKSQHPSLRLRWWVLQIGFGIPAAFIAFLAIATLNLWLFLIGTLFIAVISVAVEKWQAGWLYRTVILTRADDGIVGSKD